MINERLESALAWCKKNNLESTRLKKFNRGSKKKLSKGNLSKEEFEEMCKKAEVKKEYLCKTVFTENL